MKKRCLIRAKSPQFYDEIFNGVWYARHCGCSSCLSWKSWVTNAQSGYSDLFLFGFLKDGFHSFCVDTLCQCPVECSPMARETWVPSQVESYQRVKKWYLMPPCLTLSIIRYGSRVKWSNPAKGVAPSPTLNCSCYWKGSLLFALDYARYSFVWPWTSFWWDLTKSSSQCILMFDWLDVFNGMSTPLGLFLPRD